MDNKSIPLGFCAGSRTTVCDNLAFRSELLVRKKHTRFGEQRFAQAIAEAVLRLADFREAEAARIASMRGREVSAERADSLILQAFEKGIVSAPLLPAVIAQWRRPEHEEFAQRTYWSLFSAFTGVFYDLSATNPQRFSVLSMRLGVHLDPAAGETLQVAPA